MDFPNSKVLLVSRLDGTRGPLGVAKAVHSRLADKYGCKLEEFSGFADVLKLIAEIPFKYKGYTICIHQNGFRLPMAFCWLSKLDKKNRYFLVVHGVAAEERKYRPVLQRDLNLEPKLIREFPNLICVSEFESGVLKRLYDREHNVTVIGNGVDLPSEFNLNALLAKKRFSCSLVLHGTLELAPSSSSAAAIPRPWVPTVPCASKSHMREMSSLIIVVRFPTKKNF